MILKAENEVLKASGFSKIEFRKTINKDRITVIHLSTPGQLIYQKVGFFFNVYYVPSTVLSDLNILAQSS